MILYTPIGALTLVVFYGIMWWNIGKTLLCIVQAILRNASSKIRWLGRVQRSKGERHKLCSALMALVKVRGRGRGGGQRVRKKV